jgi:formylglycine-generating enzyme required for sulfatase activity
MIGSRFAASVLFIITGFALRSADDFVRIPAGSFDIGYTVGDPECHPNENPRHPVTFSHDFWMQRTEVTVAAYRKFCQAPQCEMPQAPEFDRDWA